MAIANDADIFAMRTFLRLFSAVNKNGQLPPRV